MSSYQIISYRLTKKTSPAQVLKTIDDLILKFNLEYANCFYDIYSHIIEYEFDGKHYSNRKQNPILLICNKYPQLEQYLKHEKSMTNGEDAAELYRIKNFTDNYKPISNDNYEEILREVSTKIPRPYSVTYFEYIIDRIDFSKSNEHTEPISQNSEIGTPRGSYILYSYQSSGNEKHSYIFIATQYNQDNDLTLFREFFYALTNTLPGKYEGTEFIK